MGLLAIEAMACGVPVIASDYAAPKYYIEEGINGYKFALRDDNMLAERLIYILNNDKDLKKLQNGALQTAKKYSKERVKGILKKILTV